MLESFWDRRRQKMAGLEDSTDPGNTASRHTGVRIISERVVVEGVILTCRTPLLRRWETTGPRENGARKDRRGCCRREKREITAVKKRPWGERPRYRNRSGRLGARANGGERRNDRGWREVEEGVEQGMEGSRGGWSGWEKIKRADKPRGGLYPRSFAALLFLLFASAYQPPPFPSFFFVFFRLLLPLLLLLLLLALPLAPSLVSLATILFIFPRSCSAMWFDDRIHALSCLCVRVGTRV